MTRNRITIAILAIGGQGGGVLADWIIQLAEQNGYIAQGTSVPGVAQRTGSTIYYIELFPEAAAAGAPVLALTPVPGDVDIVIASELMEAGRAILRGFVTKDRSALIASTHRIYAIAEKSALGDGLSDSDRVIEAAQERARRFIGFDMEEATARSRSVISSVLLGALAGSKELPFARDSFEASIRASGIAVEANLKGFAAGYEAAQKPFAASLPAVAAAPVPTTTTGRALQARIATELPESARAVAAEGVKRLLDYQDARYAALYLDRLATLRSVDSAERGWVLTREGARYLALWMSYEDTIRVADLKIRSTRFARVRDEVQAAPAQLMHVTEYMHPRLEEVCETLPAGLGRWILDNRTAASLLTPFLRKGRHVTTTRLHWFLALRMVAGMRRWRRSTLRFQLEQARIESWLQLVRDAAQSDPAAAAELVECQRLVKGYGDTHARGLASYKIVTDAFARLRGRSDAAAILRQLREAALKDEHGKALAAALADLQRAA